MDKENEAGNIAALIAKECKISKSSVYKILNYSSSFSEDKQELVRRLADKYGYKPKTDSRQKMFKGIDASKSTNIRIGVLIPQKPAYFWEDAVKGMKSAEAEFKVAKIEFIFHFYLYSSNQEFVKNAFKFIKDQNCNAYIIYPGFINCSTPELSELCQDSKIVFLNDIINNCETGFSSEYIYVGPDHYDEGIKAATLIEEMLPGIKNIAVVTSGNYSGRNYADRIKGFTDKITSISKNIDIKLLTIDHSSNVAAANLAGKLKNEYADAILDCIYVTNGFTHIACLAVEKLRRLNDSLALKTFCIGHEFSPRDEKYFNKNLQYGYIKQNVFLQGYLAVKEIAENITGNKFMTNHLVPSISCKNTNYK